MIQFTREIKLFCTHAVNILVTSAPTDATPEGVIESLNVNATRIERKHFSLKLALAVACVCVSALSTFGVQVAVMIKPEVSRSHREELIKRLRVITGWSNSEL